MKSILVKPYTFMIVVVLAAAIAVSQVNSTRLVKSFISMDVLRELGTAAYVLREIGSFFDSKLMMRRLEAMPKEPVRAFLEQRRASPYSSAINESERRPNIVFLQLESIEANALNAKLDGEYVTPFLRELSSRTLYFDNAIDQTSTGRTSDAEFLILTSQVPLRDAPVYTSQDLSRIPALPHVLSDAGYRTISIHGYNGKFWNRKRNHEKLGFMESYFPEDMPGEEKLGWGISDRVVVDRTLDLLVQSDQPTFLFTVLLTSHHPYSYVRRQMDLEDRGPVVDYLYSLSYVDKVVEAFFSGLKENGLLEDTIVLVYGDHDSGLSKQLLDHVEDPIDQADGISEILMMAHGPWESARISHPVGLQDLGPTVLKELRLPVPATFVGKHLAEKGSVLLPNNRAVVEYVDGSFVTEEVPVNLQYVTLLALHQPELFTREGGE